MPSNWTRRSFLAAAGSATLALTTGAIGRAHRLHASDKFGGFIVGMQSYTFREFAIDQVLVEMNKMGLGSVEFSDAHFNAKSSADEIAAMQARTKALGIKMLGHGVNPFSADHEANRRWFEFAKKAGIRNISADPTEDAFDSLDKLCEEYQIRIAIHNHGPGARYDKIADTLNAIEGHHPLIGACADLGHYIRSSEDPVRAIHLFKDRLFGIHLKDFAEQKFETKGVILGKGHLDVVGVFKALKKVEFPADGCLSIEYEENPQDPRADVLECVEIASEAAQKALS